MATRRRVSLALVMAKGISDAAAASQDVERITEAMTRFAKSPSIRQVSLADWQCAYYRVRQRRTTKG